MNPVKYPCNFVLGRMSNSDPTFYNQSFPYPQFLSSFLIVMNNWETEHLSHFPAYYSATVLCAGPLYRLALSEMLFWITLSHVLKP